MICPKCKEYFKSPGQSKGGKTATHTLSRERALKMVKARERKRAEKEKSNANTK